MKLSVSSYSFGGYVSPDKLGYIGIMDEAKAMGFDAIEIAEDEYTEDERTVNAIREHSEKIGLPVIAYAVGADFTRNDCSSINEEIERVMALVDTAALLGAEKMRHDVCYGKFSAGSGLTLDDVIPVIARGCNEVAEYAQRRNIKTMFENHGFFIQEHTRVERLIKAVDHPNFGYLIDIGNFMCADDDPVEAVRALAKYAVHVHAKDFHYKDKESVDPGRGWFKSAGGNYLRGAVIGHGDANAYESLKILKDSGYDGYVTVEFEGIEDNLRGISLGLDNLRRFIL